MEGLKMIQRIDTPRKVVAMTFDDGPNPIYTLKILDLFKEISGKATFFMIGRHMVEYPEVVEAVVSQGHEVGNHTYSHANLTFLNENDCLREIQQTDKIITTLTGRKATVFRPPYLAYNHDIALFLQRLGYRVIGALNTDALDWEQPGVDYIITKTRRHISSGSILLFHDGFGDRSQTIEAVKVLLFDLCLQGYQFVTISELLKLGDGIHEN